MKVPIDIKSIRTSILSELQDKRSEETQTSSKDGQDYSSRGMLDLVRTTSVIDIKRFNDMNDFDISVGPESVWDELNNFNTDGFDEQFNIEKKDGKHILMTLKGDDGSQDLKVKVKFFQVPDAEEDSKIRVRFVRKTGEIDKWYSILREMKESSYLKDILMPPE